MIKTRKWMKKKARALASLMLLGWCLALGGSLFAQDEQKEILVINVSGGINSGSEGYILEAIEKAERDQAVCLVLELDTPGGGLAETQNIVKAMLNTKVPVVVFVMPKGAQAASAGTFITMAAHVAAMAPGTRIGAAHPVMMPIMPGQGDDQEKNKQKEQQRDYMMEKVENDTVSFIVGAAKQRGRNVEWAEKAVRQSVSITSDVAVKDNVVDLEADNLDDLLGKIDGRMVKIDDSTTVVLRTEGVPIQRREMTLKQKLLNFLADPNILMILMALGGLGILMEFYHPGSVFPGVVGAICLLLAFTSMQILPVNWGALLLVVAGIAMFVAEVYVTSYGLLGIGGAVCLLVGGILLVDPSSEPHYMDPSLTVDWSVLIPMVVVFGLVFLYVGYYVVRGQRKKIETGTEGMKGLVGEARSDISSEEGKVFVRGEHWKAVSQESIPAGSKVEVIRVEGLLLHVKKKN